MRRETSNGSVPRGLVRLSVFTAIGIFLVVIMGATVTNTGSAEGCGDTWPLCHGRWAPLADINSLIEYSHRLVSGIVGVLIVLLAVWAWRRLGHRSETRFLALMSVFFVFLQAALGAMAVVWDSPDWVLAAHFGISLISFASVLLLAVLIRDAARGTSPRAVSISPGLRTWLWITILYTYVVVYLGAYVRHTGSMLACLDFPLCNGAWIPSLSGEVGIHFTHRAAAVLLVLVMARTFYLAYRERHQRPDVARGAAYGLLLLLLQVFVGAAVVLSRLAVGATILHGTVVTLFFGVISYLLYETWPLGSTSSSEAASLPLSSD